MPVCAQCARRTTPNHAAVAVVVVLQVFQAEGLIYMVQEYGEIDLARLLAKHDAARRAAAGSEAAPGTLLQHNLDENFIRLYWQQMLQVRRGLTMHITRPAVQRPVRH